MSSCQASSYPDAGKLPINGSNYLSYDPSFSLHENAYETFENLTESKSSHNFKQTQTHAQFQDLSHRRSIPSDLTRRLDYTGMAHPGAVRQVGDNEMEERKSKGFQILNDKAFRGSGSTGIPIPYSGSYYTCPQCNQLAISTCNCSFRDASCANGHKWFTPSPGMKQFGVSSNHP